MYENILIYTYINIYTRVDPSLYRDGPEWIRAFVDRSPMWIQLACCDHEGDPYVCGSKTYVDPVCRKGGRAELCSGVDPGSGMEKVCPVEFGPRQ